jgi:hypothetical protein
MIEFAWVLALSRRRQSNKKAKKKSMKLSQVKFYKLDEFEHDKNIDEHWDPVYDFPHDINTICHDRKTENLSRRRPVGHEVEQNIEGRANYQQTENSSVRESTDITTSRKPIISTTKIDIICLTIYFLAFIVFNLTSIFIFINIERSPESDAADLNSLCECKYINSGINPAWIYLPQMHKKLCQQ